MGLSRKTVVYLGLLFWISNAISIRAFGAPGDELDNAKWKVQANAWLSQPSGNFKDNSNAGTGNFDLQRDFGFGDYVTFSGQVNWRFKRKHHLLLSAEPVVSSRTTTIERTIEWQGETYNVGATVKAHVGSLILTPGYQYDFFRRRTWNLGLLVNLNLIYTDASLGLAGSATGGGGGSASGSMEKTGRLFAPLPAIGPSFRWYPVPKWGPWYIDGNATAMSFFGYGNFYSANGMVGVPFRQHWDIRAGYLLGSRLKITGSSDQIGVRLTQKGAVAGVIYRWGTR
jgi:hypothetical protein